MVRLALAAALLLAAPPAMAQMGQMTQHSGTDGNGGSWIGTSQQMGQFRYDTYYHSNGKSRTCTSQKIFDQTYTSCN